ncbi:MAG TPA: site-2 protease family protein [Rhodocyclaceae bacterium]|nr:site-2 protease family protein [Rhodocyclaceae bacterium]
MESLIQTLAISALPVVFAITLHEAAHGYAARYFGDPTAWQAGRISLNPMVHIHPLGTVIIPVMTLILSSGTFLFGWAKPVPVDFGRLRHPKRDMLWVAAAGPAANLAMAFGWAALLKLAWLGTTNMFTLPFSEMCKIGVVVNAVFLVLNLIPLPPLDGGRIAVSLLPGRLGARLQQIDRFGLVVLLALLMLDYETGAIREILHPVVDWVSRSIEGIFGLY